MYFPPSCAHVLILTEEVNRESLPHRRTQRDLTQMGVMASSLIVYFSGLWLDRKLLANLSVIFQPLGVIKLGDGGGEDAAETII